MAYKKKVRMTEKQFIAKFKKAGLELYETKRVNEKLDAFHKIEDVIVGLMEKYA